LEKSASGTERGGKNERRKTTYVAGKKGGRELCFKTKRDLKGLRVSRGRIRVASGGLRRRSAAVAARLPARDPLSGRK